MQFSGDHPWPVPSLLDVKGILLAKTLGWPRRMKIMNVELCAIVYHLAAYLLLVHVPHDLPSQVIQQLVL